MPGVEERAAEHTEQYVSSAATKTTPQMGAFHCELKLHRHCFDLLGCKNRSIFADVDVTHVTAAALAQAALHAVLQSGINPLIVEP